ncbi:thioredoxin family protein [Occultella gossypii]|uniref:Thioredoxin family protein n=1 Tax=Occultella gossypii TaxID=2800820 RepID=A0ABS7S3Y1_9MICO|nr:thioredoxin family protein [Occultella gossypii]MBZ2195051.1 thioredoxin family protein [Occultella gossypii]
MSEDLLLRAAAIVVLLAVASVGWRLATRRRGELRPTHANRTATRGRRDRRSRGTTEGSQTLERVREVVAVTPGTGATVVQVSSEYCSPCRRSAGLWSELAASEPALSFVEVDGGAHLDLTRRFAVLSTPTSLLFDSTGAFVGRIGGAPTRAQAARALQSLIEGNPGAGALIDARPRPGTASRTATDQIGAPR